MNKPTNTKTFELPEGYIEALPKVQNSILHAWIAANPTAIIKPIQGVVAEGGLPAYIRKPTGKRADIVAMMVKGMTVAKFMPEAKRLGGGYTDLVAGLLGGYTPSSTTYGRPAFTLTA
jgi:hypothetical protein